MEFMKGTPFCEAKRLLQDSLSGLVVEPEQILLPTALGRITAEDVIATADLPPFNRSTVDGFAVHSADLFVAGEGIPVVLTVAGEVWMGQTADLILTTGQAIAIPTGGMLPSGADAVVMLEYTESPDEGTVLVMKPVAPGENVIARGEDLRTGDIIIGGGLKITAAHIGALAACGFAELTVRRRLRVAIISSGDEVVDIGTVPQGGQIRDINSHVLAAMLQTLGCCTINYGIVPDEYEQVLAALRLAASECDMVLVSGGSSVGTKDYTVQAIAAIGKPGVLLHGLAVKPGKPTIYGLVGQVPIFGLPGHPVSAMIISEILVVPAVHLLSGRSMKVERRKIPARMLRNVASASGRDDFLRVRLLWKDEGYWAEPILGKSGLISTMVQADGIVHIDAEIGGLYVGDFVIVQMI